MPKPGYVLVVDDDVAVTKLIIDILTLLGIEARTAVNGRVALDMIKTDPPAAVILDLMMPIMDGFTMFTQLRKESGGRDVPVIVLSALADQSGMMERLPGIAGTMVKGKFSLVELRSLLAKAGVIEAAPSGVKAPEPTAPSAVPAQEPGSAAPAVPSPAPAPAPAAAPAAATSPAPTPAPTPSPAAAANGQGAAPPAEAPAPSTPAPAAPPESAPAAVTVAPAPPPAQPPPPASPAPPAVAPAPVTADNKSPASDKPDEKPAETPK